MRLLFSLLVISILSSTAAAQIQDHCLYNALRSYNFGLDYTDRGIEILEQPDGRFIVVGHARPGNDFNYHTILSRHFANGHLDPTFSVDGKVAVLFGEGTRVTCADLTSDGGILVGGGMYSNNYFSYDPFVARFLSDGSVDTDFGDDGFLLIEMVDPDAIGYTRKVREMPDGDVVVVINQNIDLLDGVPYGIGVCRLESEDQSFDPDYNNGTNEIVIVNGLGISDTANDAVISDDGTVYTVCAVTNGVERLAALKWDTNGELDPDFGIGGISTTTEAIQSASQMTCDLGADGHLLLSGSQTSSGGFHPILTKLDTISGEVIEDFGINGFTKISELTVNHNYVDLFQDPSTEEWYLLVHEAAVPASMLRMSNEGDVLDNCGEYFFSVDYPEFSSTYTCGMVDSQGIMRLIISNSQIDPTTPPIQSANVCWAYYDAPIDFFGISDVTPPTLIVDQVLELTIYGSGLNEVVEAQLTSETDVISIYALYAESFFTAGLLIDGAGAELGSYDLKLIRSDGDTLFFAQAISVIEEGDINANVQYTSRTRMLAGATSPYRVSVRNTGDRQFVGVPFLAISAEPHRVDSALFGIVNVLDVPYFNALNSYLITLGQTAEDLKQISMSATDGSIMGYIMLNLSPGERYDLISQQSSTDPASHDIYFNTNSLVSDRGLLDDYLPVPNTCEAELVLMAMNATFDGDEFADLGECFLPIYTDMQSQVALIARTVAGEKDLLPYRGLMMNLCFDIVNCLDPEYPLSYDELTTFAKEMALLHSTTLLLDEDSDCDEYVSASRSTHFWDEDETVVGPEHQGGDDSDFGSGGGPAGPIGDPFGPDIGPGDGLYDPFGPNNPNEPGDDGSTPVCQGCSDHEDLDFPQSMDPNEKVGPYNARGGYFINEKLMYYAIHFENADTADIPAKRILLIDSLDMSLFDLSTFKFNTASWGDTIVEVAEGITLHDLRPTEPNILQIDCALDQSTGIATWEFWTLDTLSMWLTEDVDAGFLPPNVDRPEGMGNVTFEVELLEGVQSGAHISNSALIYFDYNEPIATDPWVNYYDLDAPLTTVAPITDAVGASTEININWSSEEPDSTLLFYNVYFAMEAEGPWFLWQLNRPETTGIFNGELGETYYFQSIGIDSAFNVEPLGPAEASVFLDAVGLSEAAQAVTFQLYPNPAKDEVTVILDEPVLMTYSIVDALGRSVQSVKWSGEATKHTLDVSSISPGHYHVILEFDNSRSVVALRVE